uniref:Uncharacterized protein n=1 Tax=Vitis vinifera TaxID=29760 RepID=F6HIE8_VITVI
MGRRNPRLSSTSKGAWNTGALNHGNQEPTSFNNYADKVLTKTALELTLLLLFEAWAVWEEKLYWINTEGGAGADYLRIDTQILLSNISLCQATSWVESHVLLPLLMVSTQDTCVQSNYNRYSPSPWSGWKHHFFDRAQDGPSNLEKFMTTLVSSNTIKTT